MNGAAVDCTLSSSWQRFGALFDVPTDAKNLVVMVWSDTQLPATHGFAITEVSLTDGEDVRAWSPRSYSEELARCQRYYHKTFNVNAPPVTNAGVNTGEWRIPASKAGAVAGVSSTYLFPVPMRVAPTTRTAYNPGAANAQARDLTAGADCAAQAFAGVTERSCYVTFTGAAGTAVGNSIGIHMAFDAEL